MVVHAILQGRFSPQHGADALPATLHQGFSPDPGLNKSLLRGPYFPQKPPTDWANSLNIHPHRPLRQSHHRGGGSVADTEMNSRPFRKVGLPQVCPGNQGQLIQSAALPYGKTQQGIGAQRCLPFFRLPNAQQTLPPRVRCPFQQDSNLRLGQPPLQQYDPDFSRHGITPALSSCPPRMAANSLLRAAPDPSNRLSIVCRAFRTVNGPAEKI